MDPSLAAEALVLRPGSIAGLVPAERFHSLLHHLQTSQLRLPGFAKSNK